MVLQLFSPLTTPWISPSSYHNPAHHHLSQTQAFAARYEEPPTANQLDMLKHMQYSNVPSSFLEENTAFKHQQRLNDLILPSWLVSSPLLKQIHGRHQTKREGSYRIRVHHNIGGALEGRNLALDQNLDLLR